MKYAVRYFKNSKILDKADEIIIKYWERDPELLEFLNKLKENQRLILNITNLDNVEDNIDLFKAAAQKVNISILCSKHQDYNIFIDNEIPFFFIEGVDSLDKLVSNIEIGVSDIYITNELCFYLKDIAENYKDLVNIRVYPNITQSSSNSYKHIFRKFFIRPEDIDLYEGIISTIEFYTDFLEQQDTLYKIYNTKGAWNDDLNIIIKGLDLNINSANLMPFFGSTRLNCKKRCALNKCHICDHMEILAKSLKEDNISIIKKPKDK